jgi:hypothetical protein
MKNVCPRCNAALVTKEYNGVKLCDNCYTDVRLADNFFKGASLEENTFVVIKNREEYVGKIIGIQHTIKNQKSDKFFVHLSVNEDHFSIWYNTWMTARELINACDRFKINIGKLLEE